MPGHSSKQEKPHDSDNGPSAVNQSNEQIPLSGDNPSYFVRHQRQEIAPDPHQIRRLQRAIGNQATLRLLGHRISNTAAGSHVPKNVQREEESEGDSFTVEQSQLQRFHKKAKDLQAFSEQVKGIADKLEKSTDDDDLLAQARSFHSLADSLTDAGQQIHELATDMKSKTLSKAKGHLDKVDKYLKAVEKLDELQSAVSTKKMHDFMSDMDDFEKAKAWAEDVTNTLDVASGYVPDSGLPGIGGDLFKNYLQAPKKYVAAVITALETKRNRIDSLTNDTSGKKESITHGGTTLWEGSLTKVYQFGGGSGLREFMEENIDTPVGNLKELSWDVGINTLEALIDDYAVPSKRAPWHRIVDQAKKAHNR